jgi:hypothetical protein
MDTAWPLAVILLLGAFHGLNPGMGWLFATALALQERSQRAAWRALPPLALGHALAVGAVVAIAVLFRRVVPLDLLKWGVAAVLVAFGVQRLVRSRHPRYGGMRAGARELTVWSFLMASAHGAGLMVVPFVLTAEAMGHAARHTHPGGAADPSVLLAGGLPAGQLGGLVATGLHTFSYLAVTGSVAWVVYRKVGVHFLRRAWLNIDLLWGGALVLTGVLTLLL